MINFDGYNVPPNGAFIFLPYITLNASSTAPIFRMYIGDKLFFPKTDIDKMYRIEITENVYQESVFDDETKVNTPYITHEYKFYYTNTYVVESPYPCYISEVTNFSKWAPVFHRSTDGDSLDIDISKALSIVFPCMIGNSWKIMVAAYDRGNITRHYDISTSMFDQLLLESDSPICPSELDTIFINGTSYRTAQSLERTYRNYVWDEWHVLGASTTKMFKYSTPALMQTDWKMNPGTPGSNISSTFLWRETPITGPSTTRTNHFLDTTIEPYIRYVNSYDSFPNQYTFVQRETQFRSEEYIFTKTFTRPSYTSKDLEYSAEEVVGSNPFRENGLEKDVSLIDVYEETWYQGNHLVHLITEPYGYVRVSCRAGTSIGATIEANGVTYGPVTEDLFSFDIPFANKETELDVVFKDFPNNITMFSKVTYGLKFKVLDSTEDAEIVDDCGDNRLMTRYNEFKRSQWSGNSSLLWTTLTVNNGYHACLYIPPHNLVHEDDPYFRQFYSNFNNDLGYNMFGSDSFSDGYASSKLNVKVFKFPIGGGILEHVWGDYLSGVTSSPAIVDIPFYKFYNGTFSRIFSAEGDQRKEKIIKSYSVNMCNTPIFDSYDDWKQKVLGGQY